MINNQTVGNNIAALRQSKGMTQQQLAAALNVSHQAVSKWENGSTLPDIQTMIDLTHLFGVTVEDLMNSDLTAKSANTEPRPLTLDDHLQNIGNFVNTLVDDIFHPEKSEDAEYTADNNDNFEFDKILRMAPFMSKAAVDEIILAHKDALTQENIEAIAPYLSKDCLEKLLQDDKGGITWSTLQNLAPFLRREVVDKLTKAALAGKRIVKEASESQAKEGDKVDENIINLSRKVGNSVEGAVRTTARLGRNMVEGLTGVINDIAENAANRANRVKVLRIAAFERALQDERWDWIAANISDLEDEETRKKIAQTANSKGMHDWVLAHMEGYADTRTIDAAIEAGNWGWLGDHVWQFEDDQQEHIALAASEAENWQWLSDFAPQIEMKHCAVTIASAAYNAGARVLATQIVEHCMEEEQIETLADVAFAKADFDFIEQIAAYLDAAYFDKICLAQGKLHDWEHVRRFASMLSDSGSEALMQLAIEQGDFDAIDMLNEYL